MTASNPFICPIWIVATGVMGSVKTTHEARFQEGEAERAMQSWLDASPSHIASITRIGQGEPIEVPRLM